MVKKVQSYTAEFRAEAVKLVLARGLTLQEASQRISVPKGTLANWVANARGGKPVGASGARTVAELEVENKQLRKELAQIRMERDIVKKAAAYFARESFLDTFGAISGPDSVHQLVDFSMCSKRHRAILRAAHQFLNDCKRCNGAVWGHASGMIIHYQRTTPDICAANSGSAVCIVSQTTSRLMSK
ncbi:MAG: transposase [Acidithiobacillus sp.]